MQKPPGAMFRRAVAKSAGRIRRETIPVPAGTRKPPPCLLPPHPQHAGFARACWTPCAGIHLLRSVTILGRRRGWHRRPVLAMAFAMASGVSR